ncbi:MAG TPA: hypothetical protein VHD60_02805 [Candidatus Saccharimonadales bacterium]|nr:hypothetical protein [Candidatus Saccharimonadales bacterium]
MVTPITKPPKLPPLGPQTKLLSFDLETNGLHGDAFAIGAVVVDAQGNIVDKFVARCPIEQAIDPWVTANVLPVIADIPVTHDDQKALRHDFWEWYLKAELASDYVLVSNGYPVEYRFLLRCQEDDLETRYWQHPFPILDLTSILLATGHDPSAKSRLIAQVIRQGKFARHHPVDDATVAALAAFKALGLSS